MLDAAMGIVLEEGLDALTIARLAERLGAAVGALYRYFDSKEALLVGLQKQAVEMFHERLREDITEARAFADNRSGGPCVDALFVALVACTAYLEDARRSPRRHRLLDTMHSEPGPYLTDSEALEVNASIVALLAECGAQLERAIECGALAAGDAEQRTHVLWATLHGLDHFQKRDRIQPAKLRVKPLLRLSIRSLLVGWGARESELDQALEALRAFRPELL